MNSKTEVFLDTYKKLETAVSTRFDLDNSESAVSFLERRPEYRAIKSDLAFCREVRNLLAHNPKIQNRYAVEPSDEMIALLEQTAQRVKNPQKAKHIWVPRDRVFSRTMEDFVRPAMVEMNEHIYTHTPIMKNGVVIGVFSENTLLSCLIDHETVRIDNHLRFSDIQKYLPMERHRAESFRFIGQDTLVSEIQDLFAEADKKNDRIGLLFVTHSGKPTEKLLGIISAWDVAGID